MSPPSLIRDAVKRTAGLFGLDVVRKSEEFHHSFPVLPMLVDRLVALAPEPFVLQIGANDGTSVDPVHASIRRHGLHALLVEPLPDMFEKLTAAYEGCPRVQFERAVIAQEDGEVPFYRVRRDFLGPAKFHTMASLDRNHLLKHVGANLNPGDIEEILLKAHSVRSLLANHGDPEVSILQVDVEGFDHHVVRMVLEAGQRPVILNYEHTNIPLPERMGLLRQLRSEGYRFIHVGSDTLGVLSASELARGIDPAEDVRN